MEEATKQERLDQLVESLYQKTNKQFLARQEMLGGKPWCEVIAHALDSINLTASDQNPINPLNTAVELRLLQVCAMHTTDPFPDYTSERLDRLRDTLSNYDNEYRDELLASLDLTYELIEDAMPFVFDDKRIQS